MLHFFTHAPLTALELGTLQAAGATPLFHRNSTFLPHFLFYMGYFRPPDVFLHTSPVQYFEWRSTDGVVRKKKYLLIMKFGQEGAFNWFCEAARLRGVVYFFGAWRSLQQFAKSQVTWWETKTF